MVGTSQIAFGLITVFIATFMLFFIFDNIEKLSRQCKTESPPAICGKLSSFTMTMLVILLIIGGFIITICGTAYIMLSG